MFSKVRRYNTFIVFCGRNFFIPSCVVTNIKAGYVSFYEKKAELVSLRDSIGAEGGFLTINQDGNFFGYVKVSENEYQLRKFDGDKYTIKELNQYPPSVIVKKRKFANSYSYLFGIASPYTEHFIIVPEDSVVTGFKLDAK